MAKGTRSQTQEKIVLGHPQGLQIEILWENELHECDTVTKATSGSLILLIEQELTWGNINSDTEEIIPVKWSWIELLDFLTESWPYLVYEEVYPIDVKPSTPGEVREKAKFRWQNMPEDISLQEEKELYFFEESHDLSKGLNGIHLPTVFLMREGNYMWVGAPGHYSLRPVNEVMETLESFGDLLSTRIGHLDTPRAQWLAERWKKRNEIEENRLLSLITNLSPQDILQIQGEGTLDVVWEYDSSCVEKFEITELQAAARMISNKSNEQTLVFILDEIRRIEHIDTPDLEKLSQNATAFLEEFESYKFYEQGYALANWLRGQSGIISTSGKVEPYQLLTHWNIIVKELDFHDSNFDAVACWGPRHGPAILLNRQGMHHKRVTGKHSTYAHEICHVLIDRKGFLPLAEVFGGNLPWGAEQRANAFAAELLLPRFIATEHVKRHPNKSIESICKQLSSKYKVSFHLIANQILNSGEFLTVDQRNYLEKFRNDLLEI
jgi:Zn-dependent peptidase ImmA (M78 family)